jgi:nucleoside-diphosphate-sugar epimerase
MDGLVGHTGFVGSELKKHHNFQLCYNSKNIQEIQNLNFHNLFIAGLPAAKWQVNQEPAQDLENMEKLAHALKNVRAENVVLISTIDAYQPPVQVDEDDAVNLTGREPYGRNRAVFEKWMKELFSGVTIIRLPGLFSQDLRKNLIYDLLNSRFELVKKHNPESTFQFFNLNKIYEIILFALNDQIRVLNVAAEPVSVTDIVRLFGELELEGEEVINYNVKSKFAPNADYFYSKEQTLREIGELIRGY